jgi:hypothetical protein
LTGARPAIGELARSPHLACIVELSLQRQIGDAELAALVASPHLANLAWLDLAFCELTAASVETLARANLPALRYVNFAGTDVESFAETVGIDGVSGQPVIRRDPRPHAGRSSATAARRGSTRSKTSATSCSRSSCEQGVDSCTGRATSTTRAIRSGAPSS